MEIYAMSRNIRLLAQYYDTTTGEVIEETIIDDQKVEAMIGSGILNKMTSLGMPQSYRCA